MIRYAIVSLMHFPVILVLAVLSGCATGVGSNAPPAGITVASNEMVASCVYVRDVFGTSPDYGVFVNTSRAQARQVAMAEAAKLGATHVVFTPTSTGYGPTAANGRAYRC